MPWNPGESGNPNGRPVEKPFLDAMRKACVQEDWARLRKGVEKVLDLAAEGEPWAVAMIADRFDGKPAQALAISGDMSIRRAAEISDDQLADIATRNAGSTESQA
jgi:hypothetical protein